jgi:hypothetical protein
LQNSVHYLLPYRMKYQFKAYGVKKDIPKMEMILSPELLESLRISFYAFI